MGAEELSVRLDNPLSLLLTAIVVLVYLALLLIYQFNKPDAVLLNMSAPLAVSLALWVVLAITIVVAAMKVWR